MNFKYITQSFVQPEHLSNLNAIKTRFFLCVHVKKRFPSAKFDRFVTISQSIYPRSVILCDLSNIQKKKRKECRRWKEWRKESSIIKEWKNHNAPMKKNNKYIVRQCKTINLEQ